MAWRIVITPEAKADIQEGIDWYQTKQKGLGKRFHKEVKNCINRLKKSPYHSVKYNYVRCVQPHKFPYMVHYILEEASQSIIILGILHTSLNPDDNWFTE